MRKMITAILVMAFLMSVPLTKANAWGYFNGVRSPWTHPTITWCIDNAGPFTSNSAHTTITAATEHWDSWMTLKQVTKVHPTDGNPPCFIHMEFVSFAAKGWSGIARTFLYQTNGYPYLADIYVNADLVNRYWIYTGPNNCYVGVNCAKTLDLFSVVSHEFGHALGFSHNTGNFDYCANGWHTENTADACGNDFYSRDIMYFLAGDGYRRWITEDTRRGLVSMGYRQ